MSFLQTFTEHFHISDDSQLQHLYCWICLSSCSVFEKVT